MAAGVPVVATNVGGNPEVVKQDETGFLVPPRDPAALARAICLLLENRERALRFGRAGRQRVAQHFSLEKMVHDTERLYIELLQTGRREKLPAAGWDTREAVPQEPGDQGITLDTAQRRQREQL
jgi:glycogen synthase